MHSAVRNTIVGALLLTGIGICAWPYLTSGSDAPRTSEGLSRQEFSRESPLLLPEILAQVYVAFGETEEAAIYDKLALVATGDALEQLYLERVGAMAGGGLNPDQEIHEVSLLGMSARPSGEKVNISARWRVLGVVGHSEHMHMARQCLCGGSDLCSGGRRMEVLGLRSDRRGPHRCGNAGAQRRRAPLDGAEQES